MAVEGIYEETENNVKFYFNLRDEKEDVVLELVDKNGNHVYNGNILIIHKTSGRIYSACNINRDIGFELDARGCVTIN